MEYGMKQSNLNEKHTTKYRVDKTACVGCGLCAESCPQQAISLLSGYAYINQARCKRCGFCADVCPQGAIREVTPVSLPEIYDNIISLKKKADDIIARIDVLRDN